MNKSLIVSPSGSLYGSEQVLYDFLMYSNESYFCFVYGRDKLYTKLMGSFRAKDTRVFKNVKLFYARLFFLCAQKKVQAIYINEAGHSRYIQFLAKIFPMVRFVVHVRILEDTLVGRWRKQPSQNIALLSISKFIQTRLPLPSQLVYDPYPFSDNFTPPESTIQSCFNVGIIGRISESKGIGNILQMFKVMEENACMKLFCFHFFGEMTNDVINSGTADELNKFKNIVFEGFVANKETIYNQIDCVLHGAEKEPLGRIFLEAIDKGIPFVGIKKGGIGEIATLVGLEQMVVEYDEVTIGERLYEKLQQIKNNYSDALKCVALAREKAKEVFNLANYTREIDALLTEKEAF